MPEVSPETEALREALGRARIAGFLGPGRVEAHLDHAEGFAEAAEAALGRAPATFADLGTGGGVPGLVLGVRWPGSRGILVDSNQRRCSALREAVVRVGLEDRIDVLEQRAEVVARSFDHREQFELVTARSFAEPAVTAEIAAGLVTVGGILVVSEPPDPASASRRWPARGLDGLGFGAVEQVECAQAHFAVVRKVASCPERFPRGVGRPAKRPLW
ncbi:MAG: class I SAM-dependent methyltransferase [Actinomycetota bacterium]|nr:class I SAM-dependent methyltransferase [Actinomycetota bacterium]